MATPNEVTYSFILPAFNEVDTLAIVSSDLMQFMQDLDAESEVIVVDDGSHDGTYDLMRTVVQRDPRFHVIRLSRNFGHQLALTAGITYAKGSAVITMDADGQHPLETISEMITLWKNGYDVVYGIMVARPSESNFKRSSATLFYQLFNRIGNIKTPNNAGDFRLLDRQVVDAFLKMPERHRYLRGMFTWLGFKQIGIPYECLPRRAGKSTYTMRRMLRFAADALLSFSTIPLQFGLLLGFLVSSFALLLGIATIILRLLTNTSPGWATIVVVLSFLGGVQLMLIGVVGAYVGRIYDEVKGRPQFVVWHERQGSRDTPSESE